MNDLPDQQIVFSNTNTGQKGFLKYDFRNEEFFNSNKSNIILKHFNTKNFDSIKLQQNRLHLNTNNSESFKTESKKEQEIKLNTDKANNQINSNNNNIKLNNQADKNSKVGFIINKAVNNLRVGFFASVYFFAFFIIYKLSFFSYLKIYSESQLGRTKSH